MIQEGRIHLPGVCYPLAKTEVYTRQHLEGWRTLWLYHYSCPYYLTFTTRVSPIHYESFAKTLNETRDCFVVVLKMEEASLEKPSVRIWITPEMQSLEADIDQDNANLEVQSSQLDRTSRVMRSGRSVSVAMRRRVEDGVSILLLDISIDSKSMCP